MKIVVTGASGGLGSQFIKAARLSNPEWEITGLTREDADLKDPEKVTGVVAGNSPDIVLHMAAMTAVDLCESEKENARALNVEGTRAVAKGAEISGAKLILVSTDYVFDGAKKTPYKETDDTNPLNVYGATKLEAEKITLELKGSLVVRTSWLFGPVGRNFVSTIYELGKKGEQLKVVNDQTGAPTYTKDLAVAIAHCINKNAEGVLHIANSGYCSWFDLAKAIFEEKGINADVSPVATSGVKRPAKRPENSRLDCSRYTEITGQEMRNWRDALREYIDKII